MNKRYYFICILICLLIRIDLHGQNDGVRPQIWNNLYVNWNINENWSFRNAVAYNVLLWEEIPWNELNYTAVAVRRFLPWLHGWGGLYLASTLQANNIRSTEIRPFLSAHIASSSDRRWAISNITRLEWRNISYSTDSKDRSWRFRNRTNLLVSLIKKRISDQQNLILFSYVEVFRNSEKVRERFFNQTKVKIGLLYRLNSRFVFDAGFIYQDAQNKTEADSVLPTNIITNYVFDWGVAYIIPPRTKN